jgi:hypothetical protein
MARIRLAHYPPAPPERISSQISENPMLVANEHREELDGCMISIQSIWPAVFSVQAQKVLLGVFFSRQLTLPEDVDQPIQILTVTRLLQSCRRKWGGTRWEMSKPG